MIYRLLGELEITHDGQPLDLPGGHNLIVLAALLINANRRISKAELLRAGWGGADIGEAQLHKSAALLREILGQIGRRDDLRTHARFGYELRAGTQDVDVLLFHRLLRQARDATEVPAEIAHLRQALRLWRGPHPLANLPSEVFRADRSALELRRKRAAVRLFDLELAGGGHERVLDELIEIAGDHPTDRRLCEQLMVALYRCGHATDATAAYLRYGSGLAQETGGTPDPLLRGLHFAIARGDEAAIASAESAVTQRAGTPAPAVLNVPRQLPPNADLVGRGDLVAEASWLLRREPGQAVPIIVISGPGGIGKTALAVRACHESADRYPDGQLYADLRGTATGPADIDEILAGFLRAFGVSSVPEATAERIAAYRTLLAHRRVLVVLDDVLDGAQVRDLIPANPGCAVVLTARSRLPEIVGAHHMAPLEPLVQTDATELFQRVVAGAGIALAADPDVDRVVALCGGLPLALRIAGALRVHDHPRPTAELADRLARQGPDGFAYGELSVARTIGAGLDRLDPSARQLFLGLGLLRLPDFALWTAAALLDGTGREASAVLSQLTASFMIEPVKSVKSVKSVESGPRYRFHDLTREYAARRARVDLDGTELDAVPARTFRALLTLARRAHARLYGGDFEVVHSAVPDWAAPPGVLAEVDAAPVGWFERERSTIRAGVDQCAELGLTDLCWDLAVSAHEFYTIRGYYDDWYATHVVALRACQQAGDGRGEGVVLACLGQPALAASRRAGAVSGLAELDRAVALLAACGERHGQAIALRTLANALRRLGHLARPLALFTEALGHYEASADVVGRCQTLRFIGQTHLDLGEHAAARGALESAEAVAVELGSGRLRAQARYWIGQSCLAAGDLAGARAAFADVFDVFRDDPGVGHAYAVHGLGDLSCRRGEYREAERHLAVAADLVRDGADTALEGRVWLSTATLHQAQGQVEEATAALECAVAVFAGGSMPYLEIRALAALGATRADRGRGAAAWARVRELYQAGAVPPPDRLYRRPGRRGRLDG